MANELIVMPDPVVVLRAGVLARISEVSATYATLPVVEKVPNQRPATFVRIVRTGGVISSRVISRAMATVECWAPTDKQSGDLAEAVRAVINAMPGENYGGVAVYGVVEFSGPANSPDPQSRTPRHTWTVEVSLRGAVV